MPKLASILAVTSGRSTPSSRFRIRQHLEVLQSMGFVVGDACPIIDKNKSVPFLANVNPRYYLPIYIIWQLFKVMQRLPILINQFRYDYIWLNRELVTGYLTLEPLLFRNVVHDVDDAIWKNPPFGNFAAKMIARRARRIICGNEYLAEWFRQFNDKVSVIPTAVDTDKFKPRCGVENSERVVIGWIGTHGNLKYLEEISSVLIKVLNEFSNASLVVVSDRTPSILLQHQNIRFIKWSAASEVENFQAIDIGIMPLVEDEWTKGKCSYKLLQHMACGSMVVGSPVGMNKSVLLGSLNGAFCAENAEEWYASLSSIIVNFRSLRLSMGHLARNYILNNFSSKAIVMRLAAEFSDD